MHDKVGKRHQVRPLHLGTMFVSSVFSITRAYSFSLKTARVFSNPLMW